jgi:hypothetical protein
MKTKGTFLNICLFIRLSKSPLHGDWNCRRTSVLPEPFNVKGDDRRQKEQKKCLTNNKAALSIYLKVLGLSIK